jgi:small subunit ribosomal protein S13
MADKRPNKGEKEQEHGPDFKFIVRMHNTDIVGEKRIVEGVASIKGINQRLSMILVNKLEVSQDKLMGDLSDDEVKKLMGLIEEIPAIMPAWMLNRQKDVETGEDTHSIATDLEMLHMEDINLLRKIRSYRGIRHETGQKVRGQKSRSNGRTGATVGVSRKKAV